MSAPSHQSITSTSIYRADSFRCPGLSITGVNEVLKLRDVPLACQDGVEESSGQYVHPGSLRSLLALTALQVIDETLGSRSTALAVASDHSPLAGPGAFVRVAAARMLLLLSSCS